MRSGDGTEAKVSQGSVDGEPLAAQMQAEQTPEVEKEPRGAQLRLSRERTEMGCNVGKEAENRTVERLGGTARGPGPGPSHLTWRPVGVQV